MLLESLQNTMLSTQSNAMPVKESGTCTGYYKFGCLHIDTYVNLLPNVYVEFNFYKRNLMMKIPSFFVYCLTVYLFVPEIFPTRVWEEDKLVRKSYEYRNPLSV